MAHRIEIRDLTYTYSPGTPYEKTAISHLDFSVEENEILGVIGHTGSGKSTLIQHLNGLLRPTHGQVFVDGQDIWDKDVKRRNIRFQVGLVFQYPEYQLFEETIAKDIAFGPRNMGLSEEEIARRVDEAMGFVGLDLSLKDKSPFSLSGGQKRRVAIAGVIAMEPEVLVLDEPAAGLDPRGRDDLMARILSYHEEKGRSIVFVSHSMEDVARYAQRLVVLDHGQVLLNGAPEEVFTHSEELKQAGLAVPQITQVFAELRRRGLDVPDHIYTVEQALEVLLKKKEERPC